MYSKYDCVSQNNRYLPSVGLYVPDGHRLGDGDPTGQYDPAGQIFPVTLSVGWGSNAPPEQ